VPDQKLVYLVDDDPAMRRSLARLLRHLGYDSLLFPSTEAVAARRDFDKALCVLLDINLGAVSGIELKKRVDAQGITVPVIFMTGNDTPAVREAALQSGYRLSHQTVFDDLIDRSTLERHTWGSRT